MSRLTQFNKINKCYVMRPDVEQGDHIQKLGRYEDLEDQLEDIKSEICNDYCKYLAECNNKNLDEKMKDATWEDMQDKVCSICPLNRLDV